MASQNFESSFNQILNRTQQNLNRINQRYATSGSTSTMPNLSLTGGTAQPPSSAPLTSSMFTGRSHEFSNGPPQPPSFSSMRSLSQPHQSSSMPNSAPNNPSQTAKGRSMAGGMGGNGVNTIAIEEDVLQSILQRLSMLEKTVEDHHQQTSLQLASNDKLIRSVDGNLNDVLLESKDLHRQLSQQQNRVTVIQSLCDSLTLEQEQRKMSSLKLENWMRETEAWREEMTSILGTFKRQEMTASKSQAEVRQLLTESYLSKQEFENFRDKVYLLSQQSVASALSAWNDTNELKIKQLERELAIIKLAQTKAVQQEITELSRQNLGPGLGGAGEGKMVSEFIDGGDLSNADLVAKVLNTPIPSEMVIKGAVSSEIRNLENDLEAKLESRVMNAIQNEFHQSRQTLIHHINQQVLSICTDSLLYADMTSGYGSSSAATSNAAQRAIPPRSNIGGGLGDLNFNQMLQLNNSLLNSMSGQREEKNNADDMSSVEGRQPLSTEQMRLEFERRVVAGRNKMEGMERKLTEKISTIERNLMILQEKSEVNEKNHVIKEVQIESKVENQTEMMQQYFINYQNKLQSYDNHVKENEMKLKELMDKNQQTMVENLHKMNNEFMNERLGLERRLIIVERIAQESLETMKHSQDIIHQSILSHPTILQLNNTLKDVHTLTQDITLFKQEIRELQNELFKLQSTMIPLSDFLFYKEKVMKCDTMITEKLPEYLESTKKLLDFSSLVTTKQEQYDFMLNRLNTENTSVGNKVETFHLLTIQLQGNISTLNEETKLMKQRVGQIETSSSKEVNALKDITGSLASRLQSNENKILTMNRTQSSETTAVMQQIKLLEEKLEFYEKMASSQPRYVTLPGPPLAASEAPPAVSALAALGKTTSNINVAPLSLLTSAAVPMSSTTSSATSVIPPEVATTATVEKTDVAPVSTSATVTSSKEVLAPPQPAVTTATSESSSKKIIKQELRGVPPVLITTVVDAEAEEEEEKVDEVQGFDPLEASFDQPTSTMTRPPLHNTTATAASMSSIPIVHSLNSSSGGLGGAGNQSSLLNSISMLDASTVSDAPNKSGVTVGKVPNEWDEDSFDSRDDVGDKEEKVVSRGGGHAQPDEGSFAPTESEQEEEEDEDDKLMGSMPAGMSRRGIADKDEEEEEEEDDDHKDNKKDDDESDEDNGDESDEDFDELTAQIDQMKQQSSQILSKYNKDPSITSNQSNTINTSVSMLENSFDESFASETSSPVKHPASTATFTQGKKKLEEDDEFEDDVDSVLLYDQQPPPSSTTSTSTGSKKAVVPPLSLSSLSQGKGGNATSSIATTSSALPAAPRTIYDESESELDSVTHSPAKPTGATTTHALDTSDWDASVDVSVAEVAVNPRSSDAGTSDKAPSSKDPSSNSSNSFLTNSFDRSSNVSAVGQGRGQGRDESAASSSILSSIESSTIPAVTSSSNVSSDSVAGGGEDVSSSVKTKQGVPVPRLSLDSLKKETVTDIPPIPPVSTVTASIPSAEEKKSSTMTSSSFLENSFDESSVDTSMDLRPSKAPATTTFTSSAVKGGGEKLELNTKEIIATSARAGVDSTASSVLPSPVTIGSTSATPAADKTQAMRERLRARQEALKQQRQKDSSSSTPVRSRAPSPPPAAPPVVATAPPTTTTTTATAGIGSKKPSILDTLDEDSSFSSSSTGSKQAPPPPITSTASAKNVTASVTTTATKKGPTDEVQSFEDFDDSSFDF